MVEWSCRKCGSAERYESGDCKVCARARAAARKNADPEKKRLADRARWKKNADLLNANRREQYNKTDAVRMRSLERCRDYYRLNAGKWVAYGEKRRENAEAYRVEKSFWASKNREKLQRLAVEYRLKNPEKVANSRAKWEAKNPNSKRIRAQNRRAKMRGGRLSSDLVKALFDKQKGRCPCCRKTLGRTFHLDHIIPLAAGGAHSDSNIQLMRAECNLKKAAKDPVVFMQENGFLL